MPEPSPSPEQIESALAELQQWPGLARSPQLSKFLNYIVHAKLRGDEAAIKAYSIAVDVFGRPATFDPQNDPIVRVQAGRLRAILDEYYRTDGAASEVRFNLPVGRYVPEIVVQGDTDALPEAPQEPRGAIVPSGLWRWGGLSVLLGALALVAVFVGLEARQNMLRPEPIEVPQIPVISISEFTSLAGDGGPAPSVAGLAVELVTDLEQFSNIRAIYGQGIGEEHVAVTDAPYQLTGIARREGGNVSVTASLREANSDTALWSKTVTVPFGVLSSSIDDISQAYADQLGSRRGPLHAEAIQWLDTHPSLGGGETEYLCTLLFVRYRDSTKLTDAARARDCLSDLLTRQPNSARALAMRGALLLDDATAMQPPGHLDPEPLGEARRLVERAVSEAPTSSLVWELYGYFLEGVGRPGEAEAAYSSALQLNPANLDAGAAFGRFLSLRGPSARGARLAQNAVANDVAPPPWYFAAAAINALRDRKDDAAIAAAEQLAAGDAELASVVATVAAYRSRSEAVLNRYFAQLLDVTRFRRFGILPVLRQRIPDTVLVDEIAKQLAAAGVAPAALNGRF